MFNPKGGAAPKSFAKRMGAYPMPSHIPGRYTPTFLGGYLGMLLAILFLQLFATAVAFVGSTVGVLAYNRGRKLVLGLLAVLIGVALLQLAKGMPGSDWRGVLERWDESPLLSVLLAPLSWFANAFTAYPPTTNGRMVAGAAALRKSLRFIVCLLTSVGIPRVRASS